QRERHRAREYDQACGVVDGVRRESQHVPAELRNEMVVAVRLGGEQPVIVLVEQPPCLARREPRHTERIPDDVLDGDANALSVAPDLDLLRRQPLEALEALSPQQERAGSALEVTDA